jgi:erythromycin esterase
MQSRSDPGPPPQGGAQSVQLEFVEWARSAAKPIEAPSRRLRQELMSTLGNMIGEAPLVGVSEGIHEATEPLEFRNRAFQYLVENKAFTAIAIESGIVEGRVVDRYVLGGPGDLSTVLAQGIGWTFDQLPQNRELVEWIRTYNTDPHHVRKVHFYGFDVPGSPGNADAKRGLDTALATALEYLNHVDHASAAQLRARLSPFLASLRFDPRRALKGSHYDQLTPMQRDSLTAAIADLVALMERKEGPYSERSTLSDYEWAYRAAIGARQTDEWLRQIPEGWRSPTDGWHPSQSQSQFLSLATDVRDRAQADNLAWIVEREGSQGKVLIYASRYHLSTQPIETSWWSSNPVDRGAQQPAGTYLRRRFGKRLVTVGNLIGGGTFGCKSVQVLKRAGREPLDGLAGTVGLPNFLLDLRSSPPSVMHWLNQKLQMGEGADTLTLADGRAFDILYYVDSVSSACDNAERN